MTREQVKKKIKELKRELRMWEELLKHLPDSTEQENAWILPADYNPLNIEWEPIINVLKMLGDFDD